MNILHELEDFLDGAADTANSFKRKVSVIVVIGLVASASIAWFLYSPQSSTVWNLIKCAVIFIPVIVIGVIWQILSNFTEAPHQLSQLTNSENGLIDKLHSLKLKQAGGVRGLISTVRTIRNEESLGTIFESVGGIALLANPLFLLIAFVSLAALFLIIIVAPLLLIF